MTVIRSTYRVFLYGKLTLSRLWNGKASKSAFGLPVGSLKLFIESLPDLQSAQKKKIFSTRYIHIPRTSKYPEKLLKL